MTHLTPADLTRALQIEGWMSVDNLRWLAERARGCKDILEVGTYLGRSARAMLDNSTAEMTLIDSWDFRGPLVRVTETHYEVMLENLKDHQDRIRPLKMDADDAAILLMREGRRFDFIFMDADHTYEFMLRHIPSYKALIRPGGLLAGHDYSFAYPGVTRAVDELLPQRKVFEATANAIWYTHV